MTDRRRQVPAVERVLTSEPLAALLRELPRERVTNLVQHELAWLRDTLERGADPGFDPGDLDVVAQRVRTAAERLARGTLLPVLNATGVVLHTNLGRAPLPAAALAALHETALGYATLEYDVESGRRGSRYEHCRDLLVHLTGADDALVVNNNAAALVLALNTFAHGLEAVISRGELVEIGGAFRVPEIMARSGARLREVGSTNRTHPDDYRDALGASTGALLKVHPSNFHIEGYTAEVTVAELAPMARQARVPLIHDIGSGLLLDPVSLGLPADEPTPQQSLRAGADLVTMSGDKLMGGPQCGIVLGAAHLLERMRRNPLCRALRVDKLTIAALAATLRLYLDPEQAKREVPVLRMLTLPRAHIETRARELARACGEAGLAADVSSGTSAVGGGATPSAELPTALLLVSAPGASAHEVEQRLRRGTPIVVARVIDERVAFDLRTVAPEDDPALLRALLHALIP